MAMGSKKTTTPSLTSSQTTCRFCLGDGAGNFSAPTNFGTGNQPFSVAVCDFNGDGEARPRRSQQRARLKQRVDPATRLPGESNHSAPRGRLVASSRPAPLRSLVACNTEVNNDLIQRVVPRNFLYWAKVTVPAGNNNFRITQTITTGNFNTFFAGKGNGSNVFDSNCVSLQLGDQAKRQHGDGEVQRAGCGHLFHRGQFQRAEPQRPTCSQPDSRSLQTSQRRACRIRPADSISSKTRSGFKETSEMEEALM